MTIAPAKPPIENHRSVLGRAFKILDCLASTPREHSIADLCERTGLPPATTHRILASLVALGAAERSSRGRYQLGRRLWRLGSDVPRSRILKDVARPSLVDLYTLTGQVTALVSHDGDCMVLADAIGGQSELASWPLPDSLPIRHSAPGLVFLAHTSFDEIKPLLDDGASHSSEPRIRRTLDQVRKLGYASSVYARRTWITAPVLNDIGQVRSTISIVIDARRNANYPALASAVRDVGKSISHNLSQRARPAGK